MMNDTELIAALNNKNHDAYKEVVNRYTKGLLYYAQSKTNSVLDAEDLVSIVFGELWKAVDTNSIVFKDINGLEMYLFSKMRHRCIDKARRDQKVKTGQLVGPAAESDKYDMQRYIEQRDFLYKLLKELENTHPQYIELLKLVIVHGLSKKNAARKLQISDSTFHERWKKIMGIIRERYGGDYNSLFLALLLFNYSSN